MTRDVEATDPKREAALGRVAVWLDPDDIRWLAAILRNAEGASEEELERASRIIFRAHAALHKSGLKSSDPGEDTEPSNPGHDSAAT